MAAWLAWDRRQAAAGLAPRPTAWPALAGAAAGPRLVRRRAARHHGRAATRRARPAGDAAGVLARLAAGARLRGAAGSICCSWCRSAPSSRRSCRTSPRRSSTSACDVLAIPHVVDRLPDRDPRGPVLRRRSLRRSALPDRRDRLRRALCVADVSQPGAAAAVPGGVLRRADDRQRVARARHRGARPYPRQRPGGGGRPSDLRLGVLQRRDPAADRCRAAVPRGRRAAGRSTRRCRAWPPRCMRRR